MLPLLYSGYHLPLLGLGVYSSKVKNGCYYTTLTALNVLFPLSSPCITKQGYTHIDTAKFHQNEGEIGQAITDSYFLFTVIKREKN